MEVIRNTEHRPTVALVLSGGGAKGAAQVGALKYLEEIGMPVDFVCGTSIGGMLGGMYAVGYDSGTLEELFRNQDWDVMLSDYVAPSYIPYSTKMYNSRYVVSIPFDTAREVLDSRLPEGPGYRRQTFLGSLPSGFAYGFNVNNLISSLTVGWQDSLSFARLPVPFVCVATDVVSGKAKNWSGGSLNEAMRSTMSIPGLFEPVRSKGMVLVDGGTRNNFPTDIARAAGADYIIGIDLSDSKPGYDEVNNIVDIVWQFIDMLFHPGHRFFTHILGKYRCLILLISVQTYGVAHIHHIQKVLPVTVLYTQPVSIDLIGTEIFHQFLCRLVRLLFRQIIHRGITVDIRQETESCCLAALRILIISFGIKCNTERVNHRIPILIHNLQHLLQNAVNRLIPLLRRLVGRSRIIECNGIRRFVIRQKNAVSVVNISPCGFDFLCF